MIVPSVCSATARVEGNVRECDQARHSLPDLGLKRRTRDRASPVSCRAGVAPERQRSSTCKHPDAVRAAALGAADQSFRPDDHFACNSVNKREMRHVITNVAPDAASPAENRRRDFADVGVVCVRAVCLAVPAYAQCVSPADSREACGLILLGSPAPADGPGGIGRSSACTA
jgi:hypothetical protein